MLGKESGQVEGSQTLNVLTVSRDGTKTEIKAAVMVTEADGQLLLEQLRERVELWVSKERVDSLPEGNSYCLYCGCLCFVVPQKDVETVPTQFCDDCTKLQEFGLI